MPPHSVSGPSPARLRALGWGVGLGTVAGLGTLAYSAGFEVRNFVVRRVEVPALPPGHRPLKVLHVSDLHLTPTQGVKRRWLASLADLEPDLVVNTGDNLAHPDSVDPLVEGFGRLLDLPGVFVFGSNDYFAPSMRNPLWYLFPDDGHRNTATRQAALAGPAGRLRAPRLDRPDQHVRPARGRRHHARLRRRRRPAPGVRRPRRRRRPGTGRRGPARRRRARAVPPGARPVRPRRLRPHLRRPHPRRPGVPAGQGRDRHQLRPRHRSRQGPAPASRRLPARRPGQLVAARLGRAPAPRRTPRSGCAAARRRPC